MYLGKILIDRIVRINHPWWLQLGPIRWVASILKIEIEDETIELETWSAHGTVSRYYPATRESPEEGGEIEIEEMICEEGDNKGTTLSFDEFMKIKVEGIFTEDSVLESISEQANRNSCRI